MLCQSCKNKQATTHIKTVINGELTEMDLCQECASKLGYDNAFGDFLDIGSMMSGFLGMPMPTISALAREAKCPGCGATFSQITKSGRVGCAKCYDTFYDRLLPMIKRIHGNTVHTGKRLRTARLESGKTETAPVQTESKAEKKPTELEQLSEKLAAAIKSQEFEQAAQLRDRINEIKAREARDNG